MMKRFRASAARNREILIITSILSPYRVAWFDELAKTCDVTVVYARETAKDIRTEWLSKAAERCVVEKLDSWTPLPGVGPRFFDRIRDPRFSAVILDGYSPATNVIAGLYMRVRRRRFYINIDGPSIKPRGRVMQRMVKQLLFAAPTRFLCSSIAARDYLLSLGASPDRTFIHPFTSLRAEDILESPLTQADKSGNRSALGLTAERVVLAVGRFVPVKRFDILIRAWESMPSEYLLCIVGDGPEKENYQAEIARLKLGNVVLVPFQDAADLRRYYQAADVFVLPSAGDVWGLVINEAMANGLPVISTQQCIAATELVTAANGYVFDHIDEHVLVSKLMTMLGDQQTLDRMGAASLEIIKPYTIENMAAIDLQAIEEEFL